MTKYSEIIRSIESSIQELKDKGISIEPLEEATNELKKHLNDVQKIEENIDSIRDQVIEPIKDKLDYNEKAGKASIWGLYLGALGLIVTILTIIFSFFQNNNHSQKDIHSKCPEIKCPEIECPMKCPEHQVSSLPNDLDHKLSFITNQIIGLNDKYVPQKGDIEINYLSRKKILINSNKSNDFIELEVYHIEEESESYIITGDNNYEKANLKSYAKINVYKNGKRINTSVLSKLIKYDKKEIIGIRHSSIYIAEGASFNIRDAHIKVERIYRTESEILPLADSKKSVLLKISKIKS